MRSYLGFFCFALTISSHCVVGDEASALRSAMEPLYEMTNAFLSVVFPSADLDEILGIVGDIQDKYNDDVGKFLQQEWQSLLGKWPGFGACVVIGLIAAALVLVAAPIFCITRLCGRCGGKSRHEEPENPRCKHACCTIAMFLVTTLMVGGGAVVFLGNQDIYSRSQPGNNSVVVKVVSNAGDLLLGISNGVVEMHGAAVTGVEDIRVRTLAAVDDVSTDITHRLGEVTNLDAVLAQGRVVISKLDALNDSLHTVREDISLLSDATTDLRQNLTAVANSLRPKSTAPDCTSVGVCAAIAASVGQLNNVANYAEVDAAINSSVVEAINVVNNAQSFSSFVDLGEARYQEVLDQVSGGLNSTRTEIATIFDSFSRDIRSIPVIDTISREIGSIVNGTLRDIASDSSQQQINQYVSYIYFGAIGVGSLVMLIGLLFFTGSAIGICTDPKSYDSGVVNRSSGACFIVAGIFFIFLFFTILMILTTVLFFAGSVLKTQACPGLQDPSTLSQTVTPLTSRNILPTPSVNLSINELFFALDQMRANQTLYNALAFRYFDISGYQVENLIPMDKIEELAGNYNVNASSISLISGGVVDEVIRLAELNLGAINFTSIYAQEVAASEQSVALEGGQTGSATDRESLAGSDIPALIEGLRAAPVGAIIAGGVVPDFGPEIIQLEAIQLGINTQLIPIVDELANATSYVESQIDFVDDLRMLRDVLNETETRIRNELDTFIREAINDTIDQLVSTVGGDVNVLLHTVVNDTAFGAPLYGSYEAAVQGICEDLIDPFNVLWFGLGWCLFFMIFAIFVGAYLSWLYRSDKDYEYKNESNYDNYATNPRSDHIPLSSYYDD